MCIDPNAPEKMQQVGTWTRSDFVKKGLTPGTKYWFDVIAVGTGGEEGPPSDPAFGIAG